MRESEATRHHQLLVLNKAFDELSGAFYASIDDREGSVEKADETLERLAQAALDARSPHFNRTLADAIAARSLDSTAVLQFLAHHAEHFRIEHGLLVRTIEARNALHHRRVDQESGVEFLADPDWGRAVVEDILQVVVALQVPRSESQVRRYREFIVEPKPRAAEVVDSIRAARQRASAETGSDEVILTSEQNVCIDRILEWWSGPPDDRHIAVSGEAGSGKTTVLARLLVAMAEAGVTAPQIAIATPTTKAREVLRDKLPARAGFRTRMITLASLVWRYARPAHDGEDLVFSKVGEKSSDQVRNFEQTRIVFVDEASMVTRREHEALTRRYRVVYFGDADQLPPIIDEGGGGHGPEDEPAGILERPDIRLLKVHRQAGDSPILQAAARVRTGEQLQFFEWTDDRVSILREELHEVDEATFHQLVASHDVILAGRNVTRLRLNGLARDLRGFTRYPGDSVPKPGELLIANQQMRDAFGGQGVSNGERLIVGAHLGDVQIRRDRPDVEEHRLHVHVENEPSRGGEVVVSSQYLRGDQIRGRAVITRDVSGPVSNVLRADWGYALTVHKAQGSEWPSVLVVDDLDHDDRVPRERWNYVAYTRAMERLTVVKLARESRLV